MLCLLSAPCSKSFDTHTLQLGLSILFEKTATYQPPYQESWQVMLDKPLKITKKMANYKDERDYKENLTPIFFSCKKVEFILQVLGRLVYIPGLLTDI